MARFFLCLAAAACWCCCLAALLVSPVQGRRLGTGLAVAGGGSFGGEEGEGAGAVSVGATATNLQTAEQQQRGATTTTVKANKPAWSSPSWTAAGVGGRVVRPELRSVPGGPDPLHHHGSSPWRPELVVPTTP